MLLEIPSDYPGPVNPVIPPPAGQSPVSLFAYDLWSKVYEVAVPLTGILLGIHTIFFFTHKWTRSFQAMFIAGCTLEFVGYFHRITGSRNQFKVLPFIVQYCTIVCAPVFHSTAVYLVLVKLLPYLPAGSSKITIKRLFYVFGPFSVLSGILQFVGSGLAGATLDALAFDRQGPVALKTATGLLTAGLAVQCLGSLAFMGVVLPILLNVIKQERSALEQIVLADLERRSTSTGDAKPPPAYPAVTAPRPPATATGATIPPSTRLGPMNLPPVKQKPLAQRTEADLEASKRTHTRLVVSGLFASTLLLFARTLFRAVSCGQGIFHGANRSQIEFIIFEVAPVLLADGLWAVYPLGRLIDALDPRGHTNQEESAAMRINQIRDRLQAQAQRDRATVVHQ